MTYNTHTEITPEDKLPTKLRLKGTNIYKIISTKSISGDEEWFNWDNIEINQHNGEPYYVVSEKVFNSFKENNIFDGGE